LASPDSSQCIYCKAEVIVPPEVSDRLRAHAEVVRSGEHSRWQLSAFRARMASLLSALLRVYVVATAVLVLLSLLAVAGGFFTWREGDVWLEMITVGLASALSTLLVGVVGFLSLRFVVRRAEAGWAAVPLPSGDGILCRVCGGTLTDRSHVVRCQYCAADNLASPALLARHREQLQTLHAQVEESASDSPLALDLAIAGNLSLPIITLIACFVAAALVAGFVTPRIRESRLEPDPTEQYAVVNVRVFGAPAAWECLANVRHEGGRVTVFLGSDTQVQEVDSEELQRALAPRPGKLVGASWLAGKTLRSVQRDRNTRFALGTAQAVTDVFQRVDARGNWIVAAGSSIPTRLPISNPEAMERGSHHRGESLCFGLAPSPPAHALSLH